MIWLLSSTTGHVTPERDAVDDVCFERRAPWAWYPGECLCPANSAVELKSMGVVYFPTRSCPSSSTLLFKLGTQTSLRYISRLLAKCEQTMLISIAVLLSGLLTLVFSLKVPGWDTNFEFCCASVLWSLKQSIANEAAGALKAVEDFPLTTSSCWRTIAVMYTY